MEMLFFLPCCLLEEGGFFLQDLGGSSLVRDLHAFHILCQTVSSVLTGKTPSPGTHRQMKQAMTDMYFVLKQK